MRATIVVLALLAPAIAEAETVEVKRSYRARLIVADVVAIPLALFTAGATYFAVAPLTHLAHGNARGAAASLALRTIPIAVGVGTYYALRSEACDHNPHDCPTITAGGAAMLAAATVTVVDWVALPVTTERRVAIAPTVALGRGGGIAGIAGAW